MKVTALALVPPKGAELDPKVTPELLASVFARYSRSNDGLTNILSKVDLTDPEASIARILKFVDYGHASIGGMVPGIALAIDGVSMWLAYRLFELSPMADGQESSTRFIEMTEASLPDWESLGFGRTDGKVMSLFARAAFESYRREYARLDAFATEHPEAIRYPDKADDKMRTRIRKNYALDRCRYFLPFALKTNIALVQSARCWAETISALLSSAEKEALALGTLLAEKLRVYAPNLSRHARPKPDWKFRNYEEVRIHVAPTAPVMSAAPRVAVFSDYTDAEIAAALTERPNRYGRCGFAARDTTIRCVWPKMAIAEIRDLNRHRTGNRISTLQHVGFYAPSEIDLDEHRAFLAALEQVVAIGTRNPEVAVYCRALGSESEFRHTTQLDKFVYTAELRTGTGAHFKYAQDYRAAVAALAKSHPLTAEKIVLGEAEPE